MLRRYNEMTRKKGFDFLVMMVMALAVRSLHPSCFSWVATIAFFLLMIGLYQFVNELIHRHVQALLSTVVLSSLGIAELSVDEWALMSCGMNMIAIWLAVSVFRKYGPGWRKLLGAAVLTGFSVWVGGIWPLVYFTIPSIVVLLIAVRPILYYKRWSFFVAFVLVAVVAASGIWLRGDNLDEMLALGKGKEVLDTLIFPLSYYKAWLLIIVVTWVYALRSQLIHGDIAANTGGWMFLLMLVNGVLFPAAREVMCLATFVPVSLCVGGYMNLISLPRKLVRKDRRIYRLLMVIPAFLALSFQLLREPDLFAEYRWVVYGGEVVMVGVLAVLCYIHRGRRKLPVIPVVVIYAIFSLLMKV